METVRFESTPPGAEAKLSTGQTCQTPCALALEHPKSGGYAVTFTLNGYLPDSEKITLTTPEDGSPKLAPNPVVVQLTPTTPPKKKRVRHRRHVAKPGARKRAASPRPRPKPAAAPAMQPQQAPSPWPPVQPTR